MIIHEFICDDCDIIVKDTNTKCVHKCPECDKEMRWNLTGMAIHGHYQHPVHSDALAIHPDQRAEHECLFPNIEIDKQNRPVFNNFVDHENYLEKCNLVKVPKKIKLKGKVIAKTL